jgi:two-component system OmpR family response regulator
MTGRRTSDVNSRKSRLLDNGKAARDKDLLRILVADDDLGVCRMFGYVLGRAGYSVDSVQDGQAAWEALGKESYDLLITDVNMPRLSGLELVRRLRASRASIPIIMVSGASYSEAVSSNDTTDLVTVLSKPVSVSTLLNQVNGILQDADKKRGATHSERRT